MENCTYDIYLATNLINGKIYVGQTKTGRLNRRIFEHIHDIPYTKNTCVFHAALAKYGINNFEFKILETNIPKDQIDNKEKYYIALYQSYYRDENGNPTNGYNMTFGGQGTHGYIFTEEDKAKMSKKNKDAWEQIKNTKPELYKQHCINSHIASIGKQTSDLTKQKIREQKLNSVPWNKGKSQGAYFECILPFLKVCQYDQFTDKLINTFDNIYAAVNYAITVLHASKEWCKQFIYTDCRQNNGSHYLYKWRFEDYNLFRQLFQDCENDKLYLSNNYIRPLSGTQFSSIPILQFNKYTGEFIKEFEGTYFAAASLNLSNSYHKVSSIYAGRIFAVCEAKKGSAYGYVWRFTKDYPNKILPKKELLKIDKSPVAKTILQYDLNGTLIAEFESAPVYARTVESDKKEQRKIAQRINVACRSHYKIYRRFIWKYKEN